MLTLMCRVAVKKSRHTDFDEKKTKRELELLTYYGKLPLMPHTCKPCNCGKTDTDI